MGTCYPELEKTFEIVEWDDAAQGYSANGGKRIREAVESERTRLWSNEPPVKEAETELGREIQKRTGAASVV